MIIEPITLRDLLSHPSLTKQLNAGDEIRIHQHIMGPNIDITDPLYIQILLGVGAWFAAIFLIIFLGLSDLIDTKTDMLRLGPLFMVGGVLLSRSKIGMSTFPSQLSLALTISGHLLSLAGISAYLSGHEFEMLLLPHFLICAITYPLFANNIYRFAAPTAFAFIATASIMDGRSYYLIPLLIAFQMLVAGKLLLLPRRTPALNPLMYSAMAMLPATLLFLNLGQIHSWAEPIDGPLQLTSLILAAGLIYFFLHLAGRRSITKPWMLLAIGATILLGIFTNPGVLVSIGLLVAGHVYGDRILTTLSLVFLPCFLVIFYYSMNIELIHKSWIIGGSGLLLLGIRWLIGCERMKEDIK